MSKFFHVENSRHSRVIAAENAAAAIAAFHARYPGEFSDAPSFVECEGPETDGAPQIIVKGERIDAIPVIDDAFSGAPAIVPDGADDAGAAGGDS